MEIDIKDLEGMTLLPLGDGRMAYVDKSVWASLSLFLGAVYMYGLKEELLEDQFETSFVEGDIYEPSDVGEQGDPEFVSTNMLQDEHASLVLTTSEDAELVQRFGDLEDQIEEVEDDANIDVEEIDGTHLKNDNVMNFLQVEDDCVEQLTLFKCRACLFTASEKYLIVQHFTQEHLNQNLSTANVTLPMSSNIPVHEEFERLARSVAADSLDGLTDAAEIQETEAERCLFLCVECQGAFESIELCKQHMIQEHKFVSGKGKAQTKPQESTSVSCPLDLTARSSYSFDLSSATKAPAVTVMDVGGVQVKWKSLEFLEQPVGEETSKDQTAEEDANTDLENCVPVSEKNCDNSPKQEAQKVKDRTRKIKCTFRSCVSKFSNERALQTHMSCHSKNPQVKEFHCVHCEEKFIRWRLCSAHLWRVHKIDVDLLSCPVCLTYKAATPLKLEIHLRTHGDSRPFRCKLCPKSYKQAAQLRNHCTSVHFDKKIGDANPRWYMEQQCSHCGKTYSNSKCLKRHIQAVHSKMKPYVCSVCGHSSACKAMLQLHLRQHTGEKPHACTHCDYRTGDHNTLRRHMMRHTGQRQYKCPHCPYSAIQSNCYKAHLRNRHPGESGMFSCSSCSFQTVSQDAYVQHVADHQKGLITPKERDRSPTDDGEEVEYFPGNVAAAHLVYRYLGTFLPEPGRKLPPANITDSRTSADGTTQSITIQIPSQEDPSVEDDESSHSFLLKGTDDDIGIDTGGITIPAEPSNLALVES